MQMMVSLLPGVLTSNDSMSVRAMATSALALAKGVNDPVLQVILPQSSITAHLQIADDQVHGKRPVVGRYSCTARLSRPLTMREAICKGDS